MQVGIMRLWPAMLWVSMSCEATPPMERTQDTTSTEPSGDGDSSSDRTQSDIEPTDNENTDTYRDSLSDTQIDLDSATHSAGDTDIDSDADSASDTDVDTDIDVDTDADTEPGTMGDSDIDTTTLVDADTDMDTDSDLDTQRDDTSSDSAEDPFALCSEGRPKIVDALNGDAEAVAVQSGRAYLANGYGGVVIYDVSDPETPIRLSVLDTAGFAADIAVQGAYAYVADNERGFQIIDVSDPGKPRTASTLYPDAVAYAVTVSGNYAFLSAWYQGIRIVDITDPVLPVLVGKLEPEPSSGVRFNSTVVQGTLAFAATSAGTHIIDVTEPEAPELVTIVPGAASEIVVEDGILYGVDDSGLRITDIHDLEAPAELSFTPIQDGATGLAVSGSDLFTANGYRGITKFDVSLPDAPLEAAHLDLPGYVRSPALHAEYLYVGGFYRGLEVIDIRPLTEMRIAASDESPTQATAVQVTGDLAYVLDATGGFGDDMLRVVDVSSLDAVRSIADLKLPFGTDKIAADSESLSVVAFGYDAVIVDVSHPEQPTLRGAIDTAVPDALILFAGRAYLTVPQNPGMLISPRALVIVDLENPDAPVESGRVQLPGTSACYGLAFFENFIYAVMYDGDLAVVDVSKPAAPAVVSTTAVSSFAMRVAVSDGRAYIASTLSEMPATSRLDIVDVQDTDTPVWVGGLQTMGTGRSIAVAGDRVYMDAAEVGVQIIDVTSPDAPEVIATVDTPGYALDVAVSNNRIYAAALTGGLQVIDPGETFVDPTVGRIETDGTVSAAVLNDNRVVFADKDGLRIADIRNPEEPILLGSLPYQGIAAVEIADGYAYAVSKSLGVFLIIDVSNPSAPYVRGSVPLPEGAFGTSSLSPHIAIRESSAYVAFGYEGLQIVNISDEQAPFIEGALPIHGYIASDAAFVGDEVYLADGCNGLVIVDVSDKTLPVQTGALSLPGCMLGLAVTDRAAFATTDIGFYILDTTHPLMPLIEGSLDLYGTAVDVTAEDEAAYIVDSKTGVHIIDIRELNRPTLKASLPIPGGASDFIRGGDFGVVASGIGGIRIVDLSLCLE